MPLPPPSRKPLVDGRCAALGDNWHLFLPFTHYPVQIHSFGAATIVLEGVIHGVTPQEVFGWLQKAWIQPQPQQAVRQLIGTWSGDFALFIQSGKQIWVFTDSLGRLPIYYLHTGSLFFVGRSLQFLFERYPRQGDPIGLMEALWCGYPIGTRTLYKNVQCLPPHATLCYDMALHRCGIETEPLVNFDEQFRQSLPSAAAELASLFTESCRKIHASYRGTRFVSLSGGQDSRCVAWGMHHTGPKVVTGSFGGPGYEADLKLAGQIAASIGVPFDEYKLVLQPRDELALIQAKQGLNYIGMQFIIDLYRQVAARFGTDTLYLTGDGADSTLCYLGERNPHISDHTLVETLFHRHAQFAQHDIEAITGLKADDLKHQIACIVDGYPERIANHKSYHYTIFERGRRFFWEGEDRSRFYLWATTPFYYLNFFHRGRTVPHTAKRSYRFYRLFQHALHKPLTLFPDASGHSINHVLYRLRRGVQENFRATPYGVKTRIRSVEQGLSGKKPELPAGLMEWGLDDALMHSPLASLWDIEALRRVLQKADIRQARFLRTFYLAINQAP